MLWAVMVRTAGIQGVFLCKQVGDKVAVVGVVSNYNSQSVSPRSGGPSHKRGLDYAPQNILLKVASFVSAKSVQSLLYAMSTGRKGKPKNPSYMITIRN